MTVDSDITTNILLVDDRPQNLLALHALLEPLGQSLVDAASGEEALKHLLDTEFAVILLDVLMPGLDGFETAAMIKEREKTRHTPIIFLTALSQKDHYVFRGYDVGAVDYITKPFDAVILRSKVLVFVDLFRKNAQLKGQAELLRRDEERERLRAVAEQKRLGEQRYQELAESMPQIVWTADAKGNLTYANQRCVDYTGLSSVQMSYRGWQAVLHPEDADAFIQGWSRAVKDGANYEASHRLKRAKQGVYRWHLWRAVPVRDAAGEISSWIGTSTDIDDQKRSGEALSFLALASTILSSSLDYRATLQHIPLLAVPALADWCAIDLLEDDRTIHRVALLHHDSDQLETLAALDRRYPPSHTDKCGAGRVIASGESELLAEVDDVTLSALARDAQHLEWLRKLRLGSQVCSPLLSRGKVLGAISFGMSESRRAYGPDDCVLAEDIARRIANAIDNSLLYEVAERERAALEQANRTKDEFLAVVSHELRTPLNSILGWVQLMQTGTLDASEVARALETVERSALSQAQLISDLLDVSRIITGKLPLNLQAIDVVSVIDAAIESALPAAQAKGVDLVTNLPETPLPLDGDAVRLQQVAWNLLSNAIKFTPTGGRVSITLEGLQDHLVLEIEDTGVGINPDFMPHVFERFRQADSSTTRTHGGLGLGLSIVRHLTELHGGTVRVKSKGVNCGAIFTVELPYVSPRKSAFGSSTLPTTQGVFLPADSAELTGLLVLLAEDMPDARELFRVMVERAGAKVLTTENARSALRALEEELPDVLVSDINLPGEDGFQLLAKVRALPPERGGMIPAIAMTAYASESDRKRAVAAGFQGFIAKPVDRNALLRMIRQLAGDILNATGS